MTESVRQRLRKWLDARLGWSRAKSALASRRVAARDVGTWLGGAALCLSLVLAVTGALLLVHYRASAEHAHGSVLRIDGAVAFGRIVRGMHSWGADLFLVAFGAYVFSLLARRLHARGGELVWVLALLLALLGVVEAFTGSVLPWSGQSQGHARVAAELAAQLPLMGGWVRRFLLGGDHLTDLALSRAFGLHVGLGPLALAVLGLGFAVVRWARPEPLAPVRPSAGTTLPIYPDLVVRQAALWTGLVLAVALLAALSPRSPGQAGELAVATPAGAGPAWYFAAIHLLLRAAPATMLGISGKAFIVGGVALVLLLLGLLPWLDRRGSRVIVLAGWCALALYIVLTSYAWLA